MFSLCIPTIDRYHNFLKNNIPKYISNDLIEEIIITDENGNDIQHIKENFNSNKLKLYLNDSILGPLYNKLKACSLAKNEWIALIDSDNFADIDYFQKAKEYIDSNNLTKNTIVSPSLGKPNNIYTMFNNQIISLDFFRKVKPYLFNYIQFNNVPTKNKLQLYIICLMNTGNYIINKYLIDNIKIDSGDILSINKHPWDVIYLNTLLYEQFNIKFHVVKDMTYIHTEHPDSLFITTHQKYSNINEIVHNRFYKLFD
jgi:hypothetical protein